MTYAIIDAESDGLLDTVTKIHCLSVHVIGSGKTYTLTDYTLMREALLSIDVLIGHNLNRYDIPLFKKILGITVTARIFDSLAVSWYLYPKRPTHNLADWGQDLGCLKPIVDDWEKASIETYTQRCEADVEINLRLYNLQFEYLKELYDDIKKIASIVGYLSFKMQCAYEQEEVKWRLDIPKANFNLQLLMNEIQPKLKTLSAAMPIKVTYKEVSRPKTLHNKGGEVSVAGQRWLNYLTQLGLPDYHVGTLQIPEKEEPGNPGSHQQMKAWLYILGWVPDYIKYAKQKDHSLKPVPQVNNQEGDGLSESVIALIPKEPALEVLEGLTKLKHRISILEGFLNNVDKDGYLKAEIMGLTNTLRFQHTTIVNLPTIAKAYGEYVRGVLIAPDNNHILCGSDMAGIEEATKHHYMSYYDPETVKKIRTKGFDPHLNICIVAGLLTEDDAAFYKKFDKDEETLKENFHPSKEDKERYLHIKDVRMNRGKKTNFGAIYGAGPAKIVLVSGMTFKDAKVLHKGFWKINHSVKLVAKHTIHKIIRDQMWLWNPVSQFWYSLRYEKDKFSTLNQGTAVYCFDLQVKNVRKRGIEMCGQFHDEWVAPLLKKDRDKVKQIAEDAIIETNEMLKLNVTLGIKVQFGENYSQIH